MQATTYEVHRDMFLMYENEGLERWQKGPCEAGRTGVNMANDVRKDKCQGCLVGGAVGDALGYPVEFMSYESICHQFGPAGIRKYWLEETGGVALFSDDTQMTLFTAAGLLAEETGAGRRKIRSTIHRSYVDWLHTQDRSVEPYGISKLVDEQQLYSRRAPGNTCLSALRSGRKGTPSQPINGSKGCGGVMRVAPVGLWEHDAERAAVLAADAAAITHGHPMGWIPAAALAWIVNQCVYGATSSLAELVAGCADELPSWPLPAPDHAADMADQLRRAAELAANDVPDSRNIPLLGEGWVGDEALAIAVYACLRHPGDFSEAVIAAVNHGGDADSTGAIAGNIMGAWLGLKAIDRCWTDDLELYGLLLETGAAFAAESAR